MRIFPTSLGVCLLAAALGAETATVEKFRYAAGDSTPVYQNEIRKMGESPLFYLKKGDRVGVVGSSAEKDSVTLLDGRTGWIEKKKLTDNNKYALYLEELKVFGFLDNPDPVYILDYENGDYKPIRVSRDFVYDPDLMKNIVKENFEWENEIYYYKGYMFSPEAVKLPEILKRTKE